MCIILHAVYFYHFKYAHKCMKIRCLVMKVSMLVAEILFDNI